MTSIEVGEVIKGGGNFPHRQKDENEVKNYYKGLEYLEIIANNNSSIQEQDIKTLHGISFFGKKKPTLYRDGQNVIKKGKLIVYIPPKAEDVPTLMDDLIKWIIKALKEKVPVPIIAGLAHYQFATIHPYYDGNGRTARLLTTLILHKYGYALKGIYSLEEYYAKNLQDYYNALTVGNDEDYYEGDRKNSDLTSFLEYFIQGMLESFEKISIKVRSVQEKSIMDQSLVLRNLTPQQRQAIKLFIASKEISSKEISEFFKCSERQARHLCQKWVVDNFLVISNISFKNRKYKLAIEYENLIQKSI